MKPSTRKPYLALTATSAGVCLFALIMVLSIGSTTVDSILAFLGSFGGTLVAGLSVPWSRRLLLEPFQSETETRPQMQHRVAALRSGQHLYAPVRSERQHIRRMLLDNPNGKHTSSPK